MDWALTETQLVAGLLTIASLVWALGLRHWWAERKAHAAFQRRFQADWTGEAARPGVPATPGVMESLAEIRAGWSDVTSRLRKAEIDLLRIRSEVTILTNRMARTEAELTVIRERKEEPSHAQ